MEDFSEDRSSSSGLPQAEASSSEAEEMQKHDIDEISEQCPKDEHSPPSPSEFDKWDFGEHFYRKFNMERYYLDSIGIQDTTDATPTTKNVMPVLVTSSGTVTNRLRVDEEPLHEDSVDCMGRPQRISNGEHLIDKYKIHTIYNDGPSNCGCGMKSLSTWRYMFPNGFELDPRIKLEPFTPEAKKIYFEHDDSDDDIQLSHVDETLEDNIATLISHHPLGVTASRFWEYVVKFSDIGSFENLKKCINPKTFILLHPEIFHIPEKDKNPLNLLYPYNLKHVLDDPRQIFKNLWHVIRIILFESKNQILDIDDTILHSLRQRNIEFNPLNWGFADLKEFCRFGVNNDNSRESLRIFEIEYDGISLMEPIQLVANKSILVQEFEIKMNRVVNEYKKKKISEENVRAGVVIRMTSLEKKQAVTKYMLTPEDVIRFPVRPGTILQGFADQLDKLYPFFFTLIPSSVSQVWEQLNYTLNTYYYENKGAAKLKYHPEVSLQIGMHVVVRYSFTDGYRSRSTEFHRAIITNINEEAKRVRVELYDRGVAAEIDYDRIRLMTPEIYYFASALGIRVRIHVDETKYSRACEMNFRNYFSFSMVEMHNCIFPVLSTRGGDLIIRLIEEFPSNFVTKRYWSAKAQYLRHEDIMFQISEDGTEQRIEPPPIPLSSIITGNYVFNDRFDHAYKKFVFEKPPGTSKRFPEPETETEKDLTKMSQADYFRLIDQFYEIPTEDCHKEAEEHTVFLTPPPSEDEYYIGADTDDCVD